MSDHCRHRFPDVSAKRGARKFVTRAYASLAAVVFRVRGWSPLDKINSCTPFVLLLLLLLPVMMVLVSMLV